MKAYSRTGTIGYMWRYILIVLLLFPLIWIAFASFKSDTAIFGYPPLQSMFLSGFTLQQVRNLITRSPDLLWAIKNSLIVTAGATVVNAIAATLAGYSFSRFKYRGKGTLSIGILFGYMFPPIVLVVPIFIMFSFFGLYDRLPALIIVYSGISLPFSAWLLKDAFDNIPRELDEQAKIDGAKPFTVFWKILLPLVLPSVGAASMFAFVCGWGDLVYALTLITDMDKRTLPLAMAYYTTVSEHPWGELSVISTLGSVPILILFAFLFKTFVRGMTSGAIKQ